jgi:hypothetical protein
MGEGRSSARVSVAQGNLGGWHPARGKRLCAELRWEGATLATVALHGVRLPRPHRREAGGGSLSGTGGLDERRADQRSGKSLGNQLWTETNVDQQRTNVSGRHRGLPVLPSAVALDIAS